MATITVQQKSGLGGILGGLGSLATLGAGLFTNAPAWLGTLGKGLSGIGSILDGDTGAGAGGGLSGSAGIGDILNAITGAWVNPATGKATKTADKITNTANTVQNNAQINNDWQRAQIMQSLSPYARGNVNPWALFS